MRKLTSQIIRRAVEKLRESQIRPDGDGNLRFAQDPTGRWHAFDERDFWLSGKPVGQDQVLGGHL